MLYSATFLNRKLIKGQTIKNIVIKDMQHCSRLQGGEKEAASFPVFFSLLLEEKIGKNNTGLGGRHKESYIPSSNIIFPIINCPRGAVLHVFLN